MQKIMIDMPETILKDVVKHLLPPDSKNEQAAFVFAASKKVGADMHLSFLDWEPIFPWGFEHHSEYYLELTDWKCGQLVKRAHDMEACLIEWHSHPHHWPASFSVSDLNGFQNFVPHIMWRLPGRPYAAVVVTPYDFDSLVWVERNEPPNQVNGIQINSKMIKPTGQTLSKKGAIYARQA